MKRNMFSNAHKQGLRQFVTLSWKPCFSVVPAATYKTSRGPLKGAVSTLKALQGFKTETRELLGGAKEIYVLPDKGSMICLPGKSMIFHKQETEKYSS